MPVATHAVFLAGFALGIGLTLAVLFLYVVVAGQPVERREVDPHQTTLGDEPFLSAEVRRALHPEAYERPGSIGATPPALRERFHGGEVRRG